jgi:putative SOS response-associated peptidase YedK
MCGRYVSPDQGSFERYWQLKTIDSSRSIAQAMTESFKPNYNTAPTQLVPVIRVLRHEDGERRAIGMRWGFIPKWSRGKPTKYSTINARVEAMEQSNMYKDAWFAGQRCIFPVSGFYEWHVNEDGSKTPFYIHPSGDGEQFAIAGLWEESTTDEGEDVLSCVILTMGANALLAEIHNDKGRMPLILHKEDADTWLKGTLEEARQLIQEYPAELMRAYKVSKRVNTPKNNDVTLLEPVEVDAGS